MKQARIQGILDAYIDLLSMLCYKNYFIPLYHNAYLLFDFR